MTRLRAKLKIYCSGKRNNHPSPPLRYWALRTKKLKDVPQPT